MAMDKIEKDYLQEENMQSNDQGHSIANLAYKGIFAFCLDEVFYDSFAQTKNTCEPSAGETCPKELLALQHPSNCSNHAHRAKSQSLRDSKDTPPEQNILSIFILSTVAY